MGCGREHDYQERFLNQHIIQLNSTIYELLFTLFGECAQSAAHVFMVGEGKSATYDVLT